MPSISGPRRAALAASSRPAVPTTTEEASQYGRAADTPPSSRTNAPCSDWLPTYALLPARPESKNNPPNQNCSDCAGSRISEPVIVSTNVASEVAAARNRRVRSRYGMKINGVSLKPAATGRCYADGCHDGHGGREYYGAKGDQPARYPLHRGNGCHHASQG